MLQVAGGNDHAFTELVLRYQDRLVGFFFHLMHDRTVAEDLAQDVFLRIYRARERYEPTARFSTWLFRIAHNLASNHKRGISRRREVSFHTPADDTLRPEEELLAEKSALMPTRRLDANEMQEVVRNALDDLGERQKMAVVLHKFEGMSYQDIGEIMGLGTVAVKSLLSRARCKLRDSLEKFL
ncbi:MAG: sigma-70 family RNA polymerase sigma factor [Planctomycetaceae bacterium]|nr:sigma-70 family RNA polymerase sigma factor [Planctomycetaceae bacterium]